MTTVLKAISLLLAAVLATGPALAQELSEAEAPGGPAPAPARPAPPSGWTSSLESAWLPGGQVRGSGEETSLVELRAGVERRFSVSPGLELTAGLRYFLREIDAPRSAGLPAALHALSVSLGGEYRVTDDLAVGLRVSPGLNGDLQGLAADDLRCPVAVYGRYLASRNLILMGGLTYTGFRHSIPVLPLVGVIYRPEPAWTLSLGFPRTGLSFRPGGGRVELFLAGEFSRGEYRLHDPDLGAETVAYRDYRVLAGVEVRLRPGLRLSLAGGYAFGREFNFHDGPRSDLDLGDTPLLRAELLLAW